MNAKTEEPIRRLLQVTAAILVERLCPTPLSNELEEARAGVLELYASAADKKKEEAEDLIEKSEKANKPWKPGANPHPLLDGVPDKNYSNKQLKSDVAGERAEPIVAEWENCSECKLGLLEDGETNCPKCDDGRVSPRAQERLARHVLTTFPWEKDSDRHVWLISIGHTGYRKTAGCERAENLSVPFWGTAASEDDAIEAAYAAAGRCYKLTAEEVYATLGTPNAASVEMRENRLAYRPDELADIKTTSDLIDVFGGAKVGLNGKDDLATFAIEAYVDLLEEKARELVGPEAAAEIREAGDKLTAPEDELDPEAFAKAYDADGPSGESASGLGATGPISAPESSGSPELPPGAHAEKLTAWVREHLPSVGGEESNRLLSDSLAAHFQLGQKPTAIAMKCLENLGVITRESAKAPWRLAEQPAGVQ